MRDGRDERDDVVKKGMRRSGGRWIPEGELIPWRSRWWHSVTVRCWYLLVPLLGIAWADGALVRPTLADIQAEADSAQRSALDQAGARRREAGEARVAAAAKAAAFDAFYVPRLVRSRAELDSLTQYRRVMDRAPMRLQADLDSMRLALERYRAGNDQLAGTERDRMAALAGLQSRSHSLQDSLGTLERHLAQVDAEMEGLERADRLPELLGYVWYVVAPCLGAIWVQAS